MQPRFDSYSGTYPPPPPRVCVPLLIHGRGMCDHTQCWCTRDACALHLSAESRFGPKFWETTATLALGCGVVVLIGMLNRK